MTNAAETLSSADFRHVSAWIFDLDHTLYTTDAPTHKAMEERICVFVQRHFQIARDPAWEIQKRYLRDHGSTLAGLVKNHGVDADVYHDFINDLDALKLEASPALRRALQRLPGKRFLFTNNCGRFGRRVLDILGVTDLFDGIVDTKIMEFTPKPKQEAYDILIAETGTNPTHAAMFDDSVRNLFPAHAMGMTTVWFNNGGGQSHWRIDGQAQQIDYEADDLVNFLQSIRISA